MSLISFHWLLGWSIIWKVLLSRLGLFRELFSSKSSADESSKTTGKKEVNTKQLKSSLVQRHRTKDGSCRTNKKVWFDQAASEPSESLENEPELLT